jgi:hypothetical protein
MMARPKNTIANEIIFDVRALWERIKDMDSETLGKYIRKAFNDMQNGCVAEDTDEFIKEQYNRSLAEMVRKQNKQARKYKNRLAREQGEETTNGKKQATTNNAIVLPNVDERKPYGTCQHVMLTAEEGRHLREVYGPNLETAIDILDAYIENNGKAAKKYKNHAAVLRKGNWVWHKVQDMILQQARLDRAQCGMKSFKQADRDERTRFFMDTSVVDRMIENESKAI